MRVAIVEDEKEAADKLRAYVERYGEEKGEEIRAEYFDNAVSFLTDYRADFDVVFLDIEMPLLDGMTAAEKLRALDPYVLIVFVTNMQQYAIKGYSVGALDFIVKPVTYYGFASLMNKAVRALKTKEEREIVIRVSGSVRRIPVSRILYVEVARHRLTYHSEDGNYEAWGSLNELESELPPDLFSRCNACYLVNLKHVKAVDGDDATVGDDVLRISHLRKKTFMSDLAKYLGRRR